MRNQEIFVSLDIGTTSIKVVVAETVNGQVNIIGVGNEKSRGVSRGVIVDIDETVYAIQKAIAQAERKANVKINEVIVGIPSNKLMIDSCHGMIAVASENREIQAKDVENVIAAAKIRAVPPEREIISIIPEEFIVDGFNGIRDPRGMIGVRLELYARLLTGPKTIIHNIKRCVEKAGLQITELVLQPQAIATTALSQDEREFGTIIIDLGGGQTSASIMYDNQLKYSFIDQEGGDYVTKDISVVLNTSLDSAERIKREYGYAVARETSSEEYFPVETVGKKEPVRVDEHYLAEIIEARLSQIFENIRDDLAQVDALDLPGGFVLTGGGAALPGVESLAKVYFGSKVRTYIPEQMGMRNPIFTTGMGLVEYTAQLDDIHRIAQGSYRPFTSPQSSQIDPREAYPSDSVLPPYEERPVQTGTQAKKGLFDSLKSGKLFDDRKDQVRSRGEDDYEAYSYRTSQGYAPYDEAAYEDRDYYHEAADSADNNQGLTGKLKSFFNTFFD